MSSFLLTLVMRVEIGRHKRDCHGTDKGTQQESPDLPRSSNLLDKAYL